MPKNALPLLHRALQIAPGDARLHRQLANTLLHLGDQAGAIAELERAVTLAPDVEKIRSALIKLLRDAKEYVRLEQVVAAGLVTNPDSAEFHFEAGKSAARAGRPDEAIGHFSRAWKLRPRGTGGTLRPRRAVFFHRPRCRRAGGTGGGFENSAESPGGAHAAGVAWHRIR